MMQPWRWRRRYSSGAFLSFRPSRTSTSVGEPLLPAAPRRRVHIRYVAPERDRPALAGRQQGPETDREQLYRRCLSITVQGVPFRPAAGLMSLDHDACMALVPEALRARPLAVFENKSATLDAAIVCLEAYISKVHSPGHLEDSARELFANDKPGTRALLWLFESGGHEHIDLLLKPRFLRALTFCLVAEGDDATASLWRWFSLDRAPTVYPVQATEKTRDAYKASALRSHLEARAFWSTQPDPMEAPLSDFERALDLGKKDGLYIAHYVSGHWLLKTLQTDVHKLVEPKRFDRFAASTRIWMLDEWNRKFDIGKLMLCHPSHPDAGPLLDVFKAASVSLHAAPYIRELLTSERTNIGHMLFWTIVRGAQRLDASGRTEDARWLLDFAHHRRPDIFKPLGAYSKSSPPPMVPVAVKYERDANGLRTNPKYNSAISHDLHQKIWHANRAMNSHLVM